MKFLLCIFVIALWSCSSRGGEDATADGAIDGDADSDVDVDGDADSDGEGCGFEGRGRVLVVAPDIELCLPPMICTSETCPPPLGTCSAEGVCLFTGDYQGLETVPEAWVTHYCDLLGGGCHGVTQINFPEETAAQISSATGHPLCGEATDRTSPCIGINASPPMMVGNSQEAVDPSTETFVRLWGLGLTEASGICYEVTGPGGTAIVALTDRCGGYCSCRGSGFQECGPCVSAPDMSPHCSCIGAVPGLYEECCGLDCPTLRPDCDWCASNNHPHFDLDTDAFGWVCGAEASRGSCRLSVARFVNCLDPNLGWPPGGSAGCSSNSFDCSGVSPAPEQPLVPGTNCCCNWGLTPQEDGSCS